MPKAGDTLTEEGAEVLAALMRENLRHLLHRVPSEEELIAFSNKLKWSRPHEED